jgi:EmrB/QacA subfamily drug resistance transporter
MNQLDASIVTVAFPTLQHDFHETVGAVTWVGLSYLLVLVSLVMAVGRMGDMVGRKLLYGYGFVVFIIGSALCGLAPTLVTLIGFRVLQAIGAAMLQANSVAIIVLALPRNKLGRGIGIQGAAQALGLAIGPSVGGWLIALGGWRLIFFVNVPAGVVGTIMAWYLIPRSRHLPGWVPFDWPGLGLFAAAAGALLTGLSLGNAVGWSSPPIVGLLAAAGVFSFAFIRHEQRAKMPMLDLSLFQRIPFASGISSGLLSYVVLFGTLFLIPFYLERALHLSPGRSGVILGAMPVALGLTAPIAGRIADRVGARPLTVAGMLISAATLAALIIAHSATFIVLDMAILGVGLGVFISPNNAAIMGSVSPTQSGMASGVLNMTRGTGTAVGLALTSLVFGMIAGPEHASTIAVTRGFQISALFLALVSLLSMAIAALRGGTHLNLHPVALAE